MFRFFLLIILLFSNTKMFSEGKEKTTCCLKNFAPFTALPEDALRYLPHYGCLTNLQLAGYLPVAKKESKNTSRLFYWFVTSAHNPSQDPIILWLNGGPGASSFYGFFAENGPYQIDASGMLQDRKISWIKKFNYLMIDNPAGVGFSYADPRYPVLTENQATSELYQALQHFFQRYPELKRNPLYLSGESYAGKYIPELALAIHKQDPSINLRGIVIGDGWVAPEIQQASVADYAYAHGLIGKPAYEKTQRLYQNCVTALHNDVKSANKDCVRVNNFVMQHSGLDRSNIEKNSSVDYAAITHYLNKPEVRSALHVTKQISSFDLFSDQVSKNLNGEIQKSDLALYGDLLTIPLPVMVFNGLDDASDSNFLGTSLWLAQLNWRHNKDFAETAQCIWYGENHEVAGFARSAYGLTQIKMRNAGHMAPMDQPANTLDMLDRFVNQKSFCKEKN